MKYKITYKVIDKVPEIGDYIIENDIVIYKLTRFNKPKKGEIVCIMFLFQSLESDNIIEVDKEFNDKIHKYLNYEIDDSNIEIICKECKGLKLLKGECEYEKSGKCNYSKIKNIKNMHIFNSIKDIISDATDEYDFYEKLVNKGYTINLNSSVNGHH